MHNIKELIKKLCPDGVEYKPLWSITIWDKKFNGVDKKKQSKIISYYYYLASEFEKIEREKGDIIYISTGITDRDRYTTSKLAEGHISEGEIVCIPWGGTPNVKYYKGKFITGDNRIATSINTNILSNKFLYYWMQSKIDLISSFYRGSGIKHPDMKIILEIKGPLPPIEVQNEIVRILDNFTELESELESELEARKKQYDYYRAKLLFFDKNIIRKELGEICKLSAGGDINKNNVVYEKNEEYKFPVYSNGIAEKSLYGYTNSYKVEAPCVTISARGTIGWSCLRKENFYPIVRLICAKPNNEVNISYLKYYFETIKFEVPKTGIPQLTVPMIAKYQIPIPPIEEQEKIVSILDRFDKLCNDITQGLPAEIEARRKQYEYYRDKLLNFKELKVENKE